jgi:hypothetical protein
MLSDLLNNTATPPLQTAAKSCGSCSCFASESQSFEAVLSNNHLLLRACILHSYFILISKGRRLLLTYDLWISTLGKLGRARKRVRKARDRAELRNFPQNRGATRPTRLRRQIATQPTRLAPPAATRATRVAARGRRVIHRGAAVSGGRLAQ